MRMAEDSSERRAAKKKARSSWGRRGSGPSKKPMSFWERFMEGFFNLK